MFLLPQNKTEYNTGNHIVQLFNSKTGCFYAQAVQNTSEIAMGIEESQGVSVRFRCKPSVLLKKSKNFLRKKKRYGGKPYYFFLDIEILYLRY